MAKTSVSSRSNSLKGKIRLANLALAFFIAFCGLIACGVAFLFGNSFYAIYAPFLFLAITVVFFGRWLSNETAAPVEKVSLLAKSFERGVSTSVPKTSGSAETDELLETIGRLHALVQKFVASMDEVAGGNLEVVFAPPANSDRVSQSFQKLLAKVSESIHAKQNLEKLRADLAALAEAVAPVRQGNLETKVKTGDGETREVSQILSHLIERLGEIVLEVKTSGAKTQNSAAEFQKMIRAIVQQDENRVQEMNQASVTLKQVPNIVHKISEELFHSSHAAGQSIEKAQRGTQTAQENLNAVSALRRQIQESVKRVRRLNEHSQEISKVAKTIEDLAQRTSLVALNASVQANELGEAGRGFIIVSEEVERLAERAGKTNRHISSLNKTIQAEIDEAENSLNDAISETATLSKFAIETGNALGELEKYATGVLNLQNKLAAYSREQTEETEKAFQVFVDSIAETEKSARNLKESAISAAQIAALTEDLQSSVADFRISNTVSDGGGGNETVETYSDYQLTETNASA